MELPFVFDPARGVLICSFPRRRGGPLPAEQRALERVQNRITRLVVMPSVMVWLWPDREELIPIRNVAAGWLAHWARDRAAFRFLPDA